MAFFVRTRVRTLKGIWFRLQGLRLMVDDSWLMPALDGVLVVDGGVG